MEPVSGKPLGKIVLYDGVCNLCDATVRFILPRDRKGSIRFAPLQGAYAQKILMHRDIALQPSLDSLIFIEDGKVYQNSDGALRIALGLSFPWVLAGIFLLVPRPIRDFVYRWVARNRYRWFGREESCLLPRPEWRDRFIE